MTRAVFENRLRFVRNLQKHGKAYYQINEWGPGMDYNMNTKMIPFNITGSANRWIRQFVVGSYLLTKGDASGVYLVCIQCYGNWSWWDPEFSAQVGTASGEPWQQPNSSVWCRNFSSGFVCVNPDEAFSNLPVRSVTLPSGGSFADLYLAPTRAFILLRRS